MRFEARAIAAALGTVVALAGTARADEACARHILAFDRSLDRTAGTPDSLEDAFVVPTAKGRWFLTCESDGASSAEVTLNGARLLGAADFRPGLRVLRRAVTPVAGSNAVQVRLGSQPGAKVRIRVDGILTTGDLPEAELSKHALVFQGTFFQERFAAGTAARSFELRTPEGTLRAPGGLFWLELANGDESGANRVSSATVGLNGSAVFEPRAFNQRVGMVSEPALAGASNALSVEIANPGTMRLRLWGWPSCRRCRSRRSPRGARARARASRSRRPSRIRAIRPRSRPRSTGAMGLASPRRSTGGA